MFLHKCSYKNTYFSELVYDSCVLVLMVYSYKDVFKDLALDLVGTSSFEGLLYFVYNFGSHINICGSYLHIHQKIE